MPLSLLSSTLLFDGCCPCPLYLMQGPVSREALNEAIHGVGGSTFGSAGDKTRKRHSGCVLVLLETKTWVVHAMKVVTVGV